jgi:hypothetical protein
VQPVNVLTDHETYQSGLLEGDEGHVSLGRYGFVKLLVNVRLEALLLQRPHSTRTPVKKKLSFNNVIKFLGISETPYKL